MEFIVKQIVIPILTGVATSILAKQVLALLKVPLARNVILTIGLAIALLTAALILPSPPYKVTSANFCQKSDASLLVTGSLATFIVGSPVSDYPVQVSIFGLGDKVPSKGPEWTTTGLAGEFRIEFPPPSLSPNRAYLINAAYNYDAVLLGKKWSMSDFTRGRPSPCP